MPVLLLYIHHVFMCIGTMKQQQQIIHNEIRKLSERQTNLLSHSSQLQSLAVMLQESHKYVHYTTLLPPLVQWNLSKSEHSEIRRPL